MNRNPERKYILVIHHGIEALVRGPDGELLRIPVGKSDSFVVGDEFLKIGDSYQLQERRNLLERVGPFKKILKVASNIDGAILLVSTSPKTPIFYLEQVIISLRQSKIKPFIFVGKSDLPNSLELLESLKTILGESIQIFLCSCETKNGLDKFRKIVADTGRVVLLGNSGVGKSSISNIIITESVQTVDQRSDSFKFGRHTTKNSRLFPLSSGGELIDTPGTRNFIPLKIAKNDVARFFPGFESIDFTKCRFRDCSHTHEPDCEVIESRNTGKIKASCYERFIKFRESI